MIEIQNLIAQEGRKDATWIQKKTTKRKRNPNKMPLNTKSLFFAFTVTSKLKRRKKPKTFEYTTRADSDIRRICR